MDLIDSQENCLSWNGPLEVQSPHSEQGQLKQVAQGCARQGFEHFQRQSPQAPWATYSSV